MSWVMVMAVIMVVALSETKTILWMPNMFETNNDTSMSFKIRTGNSFRTDWKWIEVPMNFDVVQMSKWWTSECAREFKSHIHSIAKISMKTISLSFIRLIWIELKTLACVLLNQLLPILIFILWICIHTHHIACCHVHSFIHWKFALRKEKRKNNKPIENYQW